MTNNIDEIKAITDYPWQVVEGNIVACVLIRMACQRFINWLDRDDMYFDVKAAKKVIKFIGMLKHFDGDFSGKPFLLEDWQKFAIMAIYGYKWVKDGKRVTRTFILSVGRKAGKSSLLSAMALWALMEEDGAQCVCAANSAGQASILFKMASRYLKSLGKTADKLFNRYRDRILFQKTESEMRIVSADASRLDGLNCSYYVEDETAAAPDSSVWDILESSQGSRSQPLACSCSTRGFQLSGFYKQLEDSAIEVLNGTKKDDSLFTLIYTLDDGDKPFEDPTVWKKAQPNLGVSVSEEYIKQQITKAQNNPIQEYNVMTKIFNTWQSTSETWIPMPIVWSCSKEINLDEWKDKEIEIRVGIDLSSVSDLTCITASWFYDEDGKMYYKTFYYLPESALIENNSNKEMYRRWQQEGYVTVTPGNTIDYDYILNDLMKLYNTFEVLSVGYDTWNSQYFVVKCTEEGLPMSPTSMGIAAVNRPFKEMERAIRGGMAAIDKNPITFFCFENATPKLDWHDNIQITKSSNQQKIDGVYSMMIATNEITSNISVDFSVDDNIF